MSIFSRSRSKGHYPNQNNGREHYKRSHDSGGILGRLFRIFLGSRSHSKSNHNNERYSNKHNRNKSWS